MPPASLDFSSGDADDAGVSSTVCNIKAGGILTPLIDCNHIFHSNLRAGEKSVTDVDIHDAE